MDIAADSAGVADAIEPSPSGASLRGLDAVNLFLAGALSGFGPYVAAFLAEQNWIQQDIGFVLTAAGFAGLLSQLPGGASVSYTHLHPRPRRRIPRRTALTRHRTRFGGSSARPDGRMHKSNRRSQRIQTSSGNRRALAGIRSDDWHAAPEFGGLAGRARSRLSLSLIHISWKGRSALAAAVLGEPWPV